MARAIKPSAGDVDPLTGYAEVATVLLAPLLNHQLLNLERREACAVEHPGGVVRRRDARAGVPMPYIGSFMPIFMSHQFTG